MLGTERQWNGVGEERRFTTVKETMMYIAILETLGTLLADNMIMAEVCNMYTCMYNQYVFLMIYMHLHL